MKIEAGENTVKLIPETPFEREQLKRLHSRSGAKTKFEDEWEQTGGLIFTFSDPYDYR